MIAVFLWAAEEAEAEGCVSRTAAPATEAPMAMVTWQRGNVDHSGTRAILCRKQRQQISLGLTNTWRALHRQRLLEQSGSSWTRGNKGDNEKVDWSCLKEEENRKPGQPKYPERVQVNVKASAWTLEILYPSVCVSVAGVEGKRGRSVTWTLPVRV